VGDARGAEQIDMCADAAERAQALRRELHYLTAKEQLRICARPGCPRVVREDCTRWLEDLAEAQPTIIVVARDEQGKELADVQVLVDDTVVTTKLDGRELPVDPGSRKVRLEAPGRAPGESTVIVRERQKGRLVEHTLPSLHGPALSTPPAAAATAGGGGTRIGPLVYVTAGVGILATVTWASLGIAGIVRHGSLESGCARTASCDPAAVDTARGMLVASDIAGGVALVAGALLVVELIVANRRAAHAVVAPPQALRTWSSW
jgi:hypothetical protein